MLGGYYFWWETFDFNFKNIKMDLVLIPISQENGTPSSILVWFIKSLKSSFNFGSSFSYGNQTMFWLYVIRFN